MKTQTPIQSAFDASSTASDVLQYVELSGKVVLITGGHSGLGFESTKALTNVGAHVIIGARDTLRASNAVRGVNNVTIFPLDLSDIESVKRFSQSIIESNISFDIVLCNAGIMACPENRLGLGWESQFATNHLGHYVLINLIWENINQDSRIVCTSSAGHHNSPIQWNDVHFESDYDKWLAYGQSKTANALFALQLNSYGQDRGIKAFSVHPGNIFTPLQRHLTSEEMSSKGWVDTDGNPIDPTFKTPEQGAATQIWAATSIDLNELGGVYCEDCNIAGLASNYNAPYRGVCSYAVDPNEALKLWKLSAELTNINAFI
ncbi:SDR family NAD(P)-dependent oxidoreductase [Vibrio kyushuensis]|uniref:SDR family NAD(P)-dependent oxidoreductase n=1 Tax=Vibrio kyushuensis TaxID=2910249 RepID=UPI003D0BD52D